MSERKIYQIQAPLISLTSDQLTYLALLSIMNRVCDAKNHVADALISDELARRCHAIIE